MNLGKRYIVNDPGYSFCNVLLYVCPKTICCGIHSQENSKSQQGPDVVPVWTLWTLPFAAA